MSPARPLLREPTDWSAAALRVRLARRHRSERLFRLAGLGALLLAGLFLAFLLFTIIRDGASGFRHSEVAVTVTFDPQSVRSGDYVGLMQRSARALPVAGDVVSEGAWVALREAVAADPALVGQTRTMWVPARSSIDLLAKGKFDLAQPALSRGVSDADVAAWRALAAAGRLRQGFNLDFLTGSASTSPELAGIWGAALGSLLTLAITIAIAFPVGVFAAIYLQEFAPRNRWTDLIEVSINNLAAVPSIIFGLLGLAVFLNFAGLPRSAPLVGGLTLALMTLPVIVIAARAAIGAVSPGVRDAALAVGASRLQTVFDHVLPQALPGILTGTIIGMARALGETAPLLLIGMRAFVADVPHGLAAPATVLPVQIFLWSDDAQRGFIEKTSAAIIVLLLVLVLLNSLAIVLRNHFERRA
ncbi:MAG: phosphate ABC transporter, permease protein PstA [Alphaproteobacteria bacterium PA4]|nr:MAG: phosphate ABC transporter, permease protein PstA [Alphaproteobacteria bacterium PA4]